MKVSKKILFPAAIVIGLIAACAVKPSSPAQQAISQSIDLQRFMGDWFVIAHIPTFIEDEAYNAIETYKLNPDGTVATTFTFNQGAFDGPVKTYYPKGFVNSSLNTRWKMQFVWPFKADFLITYVDRDYQTTIIGVPDRKYVWIMAREKSLPEAELAALKKRLEASGHDLSKLRMVPQR
ncbi:MAG: hypothetical protein EAZ42_00890 [Verrucomicrobia bacterium]|nr:MAG: hypothetical protein EAZ42_00890 [Verrucomicrobiota bacterium]